VDLVIVVQRKAELLQVADTLRAPGGFARRLNGREQQRHQDADDRDDDEQLDQCKPCAAVTGMPAIPGASRSDDGGAHVVIQGCNSVDKLRREASHSFAMTAAVQCADAESALRNFW
jgi:hypothetical protein